MKRFEQEEINRKALDILSKTKVSNSDNFHRLDYCQAWVSEDDEYYYLTSYSTLVAIIEKETDTLVDVLRYTYGYTATSAKHISKFRKYGKGKWGCEHELTYRPI